MVFFSAVLAWHLCSVMDGEVDAIGKVVAFVYCPDCLVRAEAYAKAGLAQDVRQGKKHLFSAEGSFLDLGAESLLQPIETLGDEEFRRTGPSR